VTKADCAEILSTLVEHNIFEREMSLLDKYVPTDFLDRLSAVGQIFGNLTDQQPDTMKVFCNGEHLVDVPLRANRSLLQVGQRIDCAGASWQIERIDLEQRRITMAQASPSPEAGPFFLGGHVASTPLVVAEEMARIFAGNPSAHSDIEVAELLHARLCRLWETTAGLDRQTSLGIQSLPSGYRYYTFLGTVGNELLKQGILHQTSDALPSLHTTAAWIDSPHPLDLHRLSLTPLFLDTLVREAADHFKAFVDTGGHIERLPTSLKCDEICSLVLTEELLDRVMKLKTLEPRAINS
jgi:hypothetical protein